MMETSIESVKEVPIIFPPSSLFPYPSFRDNFAAAPFPISPATALNIITNGNITLVAAFPNVPNPFPINI